MRYRLIGSCASKLTVIASMEELSGMWIHMTGLAWRSPLLLTSTTMGGHCRDEGAPKE